jgi:hypothetical protein
MSTEPEGKKRMDIRTRSGTSTKMRKWVGGEVDKSRISEHTS